MIISIILLTFHYGDAAWDKDPWAVWLSLILRTVLALPFNSLSWENSFGFRLPDDGSGTDPLRHPGSGQTRTLTSSTVLRGARAQEPGPQGAGWYVR